MKTRIAENGILKNSFVDGIGIRTVIFTQGCKHNCKGCHNKNTHNMKGGLIVENKDIINVISKELKYIDGVTFSGGEPMLQYKNLIEIAEFAKENKKDIWCYTGFTFEYIMERYEQYKEFMCNIDVLVDGKFILEQ